MKDVKTGKVYISERAARELGPAFARAGHNVRGLRSETQLVNGFLDTLSDDARARLKEEMARRASALPQKTTPSR